MVQVLRTMTDVATGETLAHLGKIVNESLASTKDLWENAESLSKLAPLVEFSGKFIFVDRTSFDVPTRQRRTASK